MYFIIDVEDTEDALKYICKDSTDVIECAQEYWDYLEFESDEKRPYDWNTALDFLSANSRYVFDFDKRERIEQ